MERSAAHYQNNRFEILAEVNNDDEFHGFIGMQLKCRSFSINTYLAFLFAMTWVLLSIFISRFSTDSSLEVFFSQLCFGIFFGLGLIPLHELLHGLYLKLLGCNSIKFEWDFLKFRYSCFSDRFVFSKKEYNRFLLTPFTVITASLLLLACVFSQFLAFFLSMLLMHSSVCAGDFALVGFSSSLNRSQLFVYYDNTMKKTVFLTDK
ncbi:MAG: hypothetical protein ACI86M_000234 [Saprospiraceae bacterium]|jgi:hypothetical protein